MSFSPLEMAKVSWHSSVAPAYSNVNQAFNSPMLANVNSNSSGRDIAEVAGETRVQYGVFRNDSTGTARLGFGHPDFVNRPRKGMRFEV